MVNKVILIGNVGQEPEIKTLESGQKVATFSLATSEVFKDKNGEKQTKSEWHNIVIWGNLAGVVESYVKKGNKLYLEGKITNRSWEKDGEKKYRTEIVCFTMQMLGGKSQESSSTQDEEPNDLPF